LLPEAAGRIIRTIVSVFFDRHHVLEAADESTDFCNGLAFDCGAHH
jgi:hypothetical protein